MFKLKNCVSEIKSLMTQKIAGDTPSYIESVKQGTAVISGLMKTWTQSVPEDLSDQKKKLIAVVDNTTSTRFEKFDRLSFSK